MVGNHPGGTAISVAGAAGHRKGVCLLDEFHLGTFFAIAPAECDWAPGCLTIYIYTVYIYNSPKDRKVGNPRNYEGNTTYDILEILLGMLWSVIYYMCHIYPSWHRIGNVRMRARVCTHAYTIIYVHTHMILLVETICLDAVCTYKYVNVYIYVCVYVYIYNIIILYTLPKYNTQ